MPPVLDGLQDVNRFDVFLPFQVRDGSGYPEYPVVGPPGEAQFFCGGTESRFRITAEGAELFNHAGGHPGVAPYPCFFQTFPL